MILLKRLFQLMLLIIIVYCAKPFWEGPVSKYVNLSFLEPVDRKVESVLTSDSLSTAMVTARNTIDKVVLFVTSKSDEIEEKIPTKDLKPTLHQPQASQISIHNIEIGSPSTTVQAELGVPKSRTKNEYGSEWLTYHNDYRNFVMVALDEHQNVDAIYTNDDLISSSTGIQYGSTKAEVREAMGQPVTEIRKGLTIYALQDDEGLDVFKTGDIYTYVFYDLHENDTVTAVQLVSATLEQKKTNIYATSSEQLRNGFEKQLFDLTNAARVRHGRSILAWDGSVAATARKHSKDMAVHNYFSHDNLQGQSPFDRMEVDNIRFRRAGENLAYGQSSSIFAHEGLMNSKGHRENILIKDYSHLGIGVDFNDKSKPYYTENFYLK